MALSIASALAAADQQHVDALRGQISALLVEASSNPRPLRESLALERRFGTVISNPAFGELTSAERHEVLAKGGALALALSDERQAKIWNEMAMQLPEAGALDWAQGLRAAIGSRDNRATLASLKALVRDHPETISSIEPELIANATTAIWSDESMDRLEYAQALFDAKYRVLGRIEPNYLWQDLVVGLARKGQMDAARKVAERITDVEVLISLRSDRRFDAVFHENPRLKDLEGILRAQLATTRMVVDEHPTSRIAFYEHFDVLLRAGRAQEALALANDMLRLAPWSGRMGKAAYDEIKPNWVYDSQSDAYEYLGDWDRALVSLQQGAAFGESGETNYSQPLNLAYLYCRVGRPKEALKTLRKIGRASEYGEMVRARVEVCAAMQLDRAKDVAQVLERMQTHRKVSPLAYLNALIAANELDEAAEWLISLLKDEEQRLSVLAYLQDDDSSAQTDVDVEFSQHLQSLLARPDVNVVLDSVGHVERYRLQA